MSHQFLDTFAGRVLYDLIVVAAILIPISSRKARRSWLVRTGGSVLVLSVALLMLAPGLLVFALFYFLAPFGILLMLVGSVISFVTSGQRLQHDLDALFAAARHSARVWPDDAPLAETDRVARHGPAAGPALAARLQFDSVERLDHEAWSTTFEQQLELALCKIYGQQPAGGRTVYDVRATATENSTVKPFWEAKVRARR